MAAQVLNSYSMSSKPIDDEVQFSKRDVILVATLAAGLNARQTPWICSKRCRQCSYTFLLRCASPALCQRQTA